MPPSQKSSEPPRTFDWQSLASTVEFRRLVQEKRRFILPATIFFIVYYFALPILVGYFPEFMKQKVLGPVNIAYLFALSQFVMAWVLAWVYMRVAVRFDRLAHDVASKGSAESR
jgi:uncharacterized membrane protein (DUF485 family)